MRRPCAPRRRTGFDATLRLAGGRAAVFHDGTMEIGHAVPEEEPRAGIHERFERTAGRLARALGRLGVDARVGEVPGEYCPGRYSVNARGAVKLAGIGQRVVAGGSHTGVVLVVRRGAHNDVLRPVYDALGLAWAPEVTGPWRRSARARAGARCEALLAEYARDYELVEAELDDATLALARELAPEHRPHA